MQASRPADRYVNEDAADTLYIQTQSQGRDDRMESFETSKPSPSDIPINCLPQQGIKCSNILACEEQFASNHIIINMIK